MQAERKELIRNTKIVSFGQTMRKKGKTTEFLKECMADALLDLMQETPAEKLTVQTIVDRAGTGRATWFRHFHSKEEAITFKLILEWERWADIHKLKERKQFDPDNAKTFFEFNRSIKSQLKTIYANRMESAVYDAFQTVMQTDPARHYESRFYYSGLYGLLDEWIKSGFDLSPEEMAQTVKDMMARH